jgi:hypothetical protein
MQKKELRYRITKIQLVCEIFSNNLLESIFFFAKQAIKVDIVNKKTRN